MIAPCNGLQGDAICSQPSQKHRGKPLLLTISVLGSFMCITQHTGPTALRPSLEGINACINVSVDSRGKYFLIALML